MLILLFSVSLTKTTKKGLEAKQNLIEEVSSFLLDHTSTSRLPGFWDGLFWYLDNALHYLDTKHSKYINAVVYGYINNFVSISILSLYHHCAIVIDGKKLIFLFLPS